MKYFKNSNKWFISPSKYGAKPIPYLFINNAQLKFARLVSTFITRCRHNKTFMI